MQSWSAWIIAFAGFAIGMIAGFAVRQAKLCSFGAVEDLLIGGDSRRLRVFALALGVALLGTQALIAFGVLAPDQTSYTPSALPLLSTVIGAVLFGIGMALVGTCGFGSLVRLGTGDLRSLVVVLVLGALAYATLRGIFAAPRITVLEAVAVPMPDGLRSDLPSLIKYLIDSEWRGALALTIGAALCFSALGSSRMWRTPRLLTAGAVLGVMVTLGWLTTTLLHDDFAGPARPQSLTFVSTVGKALFASLISTANLADFGVSSVFGVIAGAFLSAWWSDDLRWEAFDDDREMRRHLTGAALMGFGGILAGGCTIGQGLTAGSLMALSWPFAVGGMILGARIGIAILMGDMPFRARRGKQRLEL